MMNMVEVITLRRCKHCGFLLYSTDLRRRYHAECAAVVERRKNNEALVRFRKRHGNKKVIQWCKEHPEKRRQHNATYIKKHREERVEYNKNYREIHPSWYQQQLQKNNEKLFERRHTRGHCPKCGGKANRSSTLGFCTLCLFKRSEEKYNKRRDTNKIDLRLLRKEYEHLIPEQLYDPWVDEYLYIIHSKVRIGLIEKTGAKRTWKAKEVQTVWNAYREQQFINDAIRESQMTHLF